MKVQIRAKNNHNQRIEANRYPLPEQDGWYTETKYAPGVSTVTYFSVSHWEEVPQEKEVEG